MKSRYNTFNNNGKDASGRRIQYCCEMCTRTLDDCLFVDEETKQFTPYCKVCRRLIREGVNETPPAPKLINKEKTAYVLPPKTQTIMKMDANIPNDFFEWDNYLQRPIINKKYLYGVIPCINWSNCTDHSICSTSVKAKLLFHRQTFS